MKLPRFAVKNYQFTTTIITLLVLMGIVSFMNMPRSEDPPVSPPGSNVIVVYPGANPADLEELVVDPIEETINELEDIKEISTTITDGLAVIGVEFTSGSDPDDKYSDVIRNVNSVRGELPEEIVRFDIVKWSIADVKVMQLAIVSDTASYRALEKEAERLEDEFNKVAGIKDIEIGAYPEQQIRVSLDLERIAQMNIPLDYVIGAIQSNNTNIPGGSIDIKSKRFNVKTSGSYDSIDEISNTVVSGYDNKVVYLKDIADVEYGYEDDKHIARVDGKKAVYVNATQKIGTNIYDVMDGLKSRLAEFEEGLPESMEIITVFDQSVSVTKRLDGFFMNLLQGLILVGLVIIFAIGLRASIIVMMAIPISIMIGIGTLDLAGYGLEQMSITGLVIALGLLVDNAIVVTENISRFIKGGMDKEEAADKGTSQIAWAIVSSTVTTMLAFVPIIMMQDITGDFIRSMPLTVVFTLGASLLISLTLTPFLSSRFLTVESASRTSRIRKLMDGVIEGRYRKTLDGALKKPKTTILIAVLIFFGAVSLFPLIGVSFFPKAEKPQFLINIDAPEGTSIYETDRIANYVASVLDTTDNIDSYAVNVGKGNPRIYYNQLEKNEKSNIGQVFVTLKEFDVEGFDIMLHQLRGEFDNYAGAKITVKEFEQGPPIEAPIAIRIIGEDLEVLKRISKDVEKMFKQTEGTINVDNPLGTEKTDLRIKINRDKAGMYGVQIAQIDKTVRAAVAGITASKYRDSEGKEYGIVVRLPVEGHTKFTDLNKIYVTSVTGAQVPLRQLASFGFESSPMQINHYNLERNVMITADVEGSQSVNDVTLGIIEKLDGYNWPRGYRYYAAGELESRQESFGGMMQAIIIAMVGIFGVLVLQFNSFRQPLIVYAAIPLALIGSLIALFITGYSFSFTAFVGLTSLVGIVINNSIILVDYTNQLIAEEGKTMLEALKEAGETRFVPIVLTTGTTIGGLLPLTLTGGTMWAPMGWTIIGGLLVSTFLTLVVVPVLYKVFTNEEAKQNT